METAITQTALEQQESSLQQSDELPVALVFSATGVSSQSDSSSSRDSSQSLAEDPQSLSLSVRHLPVQLDIRVPLASFRVRDLVALTGGIVLETEWPASEDLPLGSAGVQLMWAEFEVVDQRLAARITRIV